MLVLLKLDPSVDGIPIIYIYIPHLFGRIWWFNLHWLGVLPHPRCGGLLHAGFQAQEPRQGRP